MAAIAQTIAIVDRSGKVVSTSKQLKNVFKEAKYAYLERKAEIAADRKAKQDHELQKAIAAVSLQEEEASRSGSRHRRDSRRELEFEPSRRRPTGERHLSSSSARSGRHSVSAQYPRDHHSRSPSHSPQFEDNYYNFARSAPVSPSERVASHELIRRRTDMDLAMAHQRQHTLSRSNSEPLTVDMDLAYGEYHPEPAGPLYRESNPTELNGLVSKVKMLLDEANCAQASVTAIVSHLQKNPDAMAAVALTLAEISNIVSKMAPGALTALKGSAPAVFALLASPQFLIAAGVGLGVTIVMFGGYKIIKKIKAKNAAKEESVDEMLEIGTDVSSIEHWRRGIADADGYSVYSGGTSVEGEFITPAAAASMRDLPASAVHTRTEEVRGAKKEKKKSKHSKTAKSERSEGSQSKRSRNSSKTDSATGTDSEKNRKALVKITKPSPLRRLFDRD